MREHCVVEDTGSVQPNVGKEEEDHQPDPFRAGIEEVKSYQECRSRADICQILQPRHLDWLSICNDAKGGSEDGYHQCGCSHCIGPNSVTSHVDVCDSGS